jgi:ribosomal protein S18 acetylase RimI-like enzyme
LDLVNCQLAEIKTGPFQFKRLKPEAVEDLTAVQNRSFSDTWGFNVNTLEEIAYRIDTVSSRPENVIMVYQGGKSVAYCWTRIHRSGTFAGCKGEIHMLGVDPDYRRQSIGRNVLTAGLSLLKEKGVGVVELMADSEMPAAMALYESAGFSKYMRTEWYEMEL